jgi:hypothetical protein
MDLVGGAFFYQGGGSLYIPSALLHEGWGQDVSVHVTGPDLKPLPDRVEVTYYSYLENKFYRGSFPLPYEKILQHFNEGFRIFDDPSAERGTYRRMVVGVAPGGAVAVWLSGIERQVEVFFGYAEEVKLDWEQAQGFPEAERERSRLETLEESAEVDSLVARYMDRVPFGLWETYRKPYRWRPVFEGINWPERLRKMHFFNGERDYMMLPAEAPAEWVERPLPSYYGVIDEVTKQSYRIYFDEQEIFAVFERFGGEGQPVELVFERRPKAEGGGETLHMNARSGAEAVELTKTRFEVYRAR